MICGTPGSGICTFGGSWARAASAPSDRRPTAASDSTRFSLMGLLLLGAARGEVLEELVARLPQLLDVLVGLVRQLVLGGAAPQQALALRVEDVHDQRAHRVLGLGRGGRARAAEAPVAVPPHPGVEGVQAPP